MRRSLLVVSALALWAVPQTALAATVGVSSWDDAAARSTERELPVLLELGTKW